MLVCKIKKLNNAISKKFWSRCIENEYNKDSRFIFEKTIFATPHGVQLVDEFKFSPRELEIFKNNILPILLNEKIIEKVFFITENSGLITKSPNNQPTERFNYQFTEKGLKELRKHYDQNLLKESKNHLTIIINRIKKLGELSTNLNSLIIIVAGITGWWNHEKIFIWIKHLFYNLNF